MTTSAKRGERFFPLFAWFLLLFVVGSFGGRALFAAGNLPPLTWLHHAHAVAMLSWFALFAFQPTLIHLGKVDTHRLLGRLSPVVVLAFIGFGLSISKLNWQRIGEPLVATANGVNLLWFAGLYVAAIAWRRHAATHKRLMVYASLMLMGPAAGRIPEIFGQPSLLAVPLMLGMQLAPLLNDIVVHRRVHPATWVGLSLALASILVILGLGGSDAWVAVLEEVLGPPGE